MKIPAAEYQEQEYDLVTVELGSESTDWWLVDENGQLVKASQYECAENEVAYYLDFWEFRELLPKEEGCDYLAELADYYFMLERDKWL